SVFVFSSRRRHTISKRDWSSDVCSSDLERNNRTKVRNAARRGTVVYKAGRNELAIFVELMKETGERDGFLTRDITYFESMYDHLNPHGHMELFLVKLIPEDVSAS